MVEKIIESTGTRSLAGENLVYDIDDVLDIGSKKNEDSTI